MEKTMNYHVAIPSHNRASTCMFTIDNLGLDPENCTIFVNNSKQKNEYSKHARCEVLVTDREGITPNRNSILDHYGMGERVLMLDDDVINVKKLVGEKVMKPVSGRELQSFVEMAFFQCDRVGCHLWGVYPIANHFFMSSTISSNNFIIGTFSGIIVTELRMDEELGLKEDYDFTIQHIFRDRKVLRYNSLAVHAKHYQNKGGCVDYRTAEMEQKAIAVLKAKYPSFVVDNPRRENEILLKFSVEKGKANSSEKRV